MTIDDLVREARSRLQRLEPKEALADGTLIVDRARMTELGFTRATDMVGGFARREHGLPVLRAPDVDDEAVPGSGLSPARW